MQIENDKDLAMMYIDGYLHSVYTMVSDKEPQDAIEVEAMDMFLKAVKQGWLHEVIGEAFDIEETFTQ